MQLLLFSYVSLSSIDCVLFLSAQTKHSRLQGKGQNTARVLSVWLQKMGALVHERSLQHLRTVTARMK